MKLAESNYISVLNKTFFKEVFTKCSKFEYDRNSPPYVVFTYL